MKRVKCPSDPSSSMRMGTPFCPSLPPAPKVTLYPQHCLCFEVPLSPATSPHGLTSCSHVLGPHRVPWGPHRAVRLPVEDPSFSTNNAASPLSSGASLPTVSGPISIAVAHLPKFHSGSRGDEHPSASASLPVNLCAALPPGT